MMFRILPIAEVFILPYLPVEMWSTILRLLDLKSLLAAARADKTWMAVCQGDPVLRKKLRQAIYEEREQVKNFMLDPGQSAKVTRLVPSTKNFAENLKKVVFTCPKPREEFFPDLKRNVGSAKRKAPNKSSRRRDNNKFCPYRL
ncbi:hypothetical protein NQ315_005154 [Exocentrus adspersus]|uniref:F-box domain-containing protein n=1 Tax=Exocentrus adspersus TaxID=1586481 RepID=A0AAV8VUZ6_9CUCU|nr:hypothetical protein NQ315_005154 [Exocentrus adspersus]